MVSRHERIFKGGEGEDHGGGEAGGQAGGAGDGAVLTVKYANFKGGRGKGGLCGIVKMCLLVCV